MVKPESTNDTARDLNLSIYLALGDEQECNVVAATLEQLTHHVVFHTNSGKEMLVKCLNQTPDVAIVGPGLTGMSCYELLNQMSQKVDCPAIALVPASELDRARRLMQDDLMGILVQPTTRNHLRPSIYLARRRYAEKKGLMQQVDDLERALESMEGRVG